MADEAEVSKVVLYAATGVDATVQASKVVVYILLEPSDVSADDTIRHSMVFSNVVRKPTR